MADKPQQQTLSVRISESLRARLERARKLASKTGEAVSTSEIAKQLLESAREDRLEVVNLLTDPTEALLQIRRKGEAQHPLSQAEWTLLAHFVQEGVEAYSAKTPNAVSRESWVGNSWTPSSLSTCCEGIARRHQTLTIWATCPPSVVRQRASEAPSRSPRRSCVERRPKPGNE